MTDKIILLPIIIPLLAGILALITPKRLRLATEAIALLASLLNLVAAIILFKSNLTFYLPWAGWGL
jgi:formate hydrogenlyase subunit 3/multisubunit Na+/H+ antiporter MnhD subunit